MTRAILQAPGFIYLTELGDSTAASPAGKTTLTPHEIASLLSYLATAGPPDQALLDNVDALATADGREQQLRRLLPTLEARTRLVRVVREWLGIDGIAELDKDSNVYPSFAAHRNAIAAESVSFIDEVLSNGAGTLQELLGAEWTIIANGATDEQVSAYYADHYGLGAGGDRPRAPCSAARRAAPAWDPEPGGVPVGVRHATERSPSCAAWRSCAGWRASTSPTPPSWTSTSCRPSPIPARPRRRARSTPCTPPTRCARPATGASTTSASRSSSSTAWARFRANRGGRQDGRGHGMLPVDTATTVAGTGTDFDGDYADSNALALALATSATVRDCLARQMFRAVAGRSDASVRAPRTLRRAVAAAARRSAGQHRSRRWSPTCRSASSSAEHGASEQQARRPPFVPARRGRRLRARRCRSTACSRTRWRRRRARPCRCAS